MEKEKGKMKESTKLEIRALTNKDKKHFKSHYMLLMWGVYFWVWIFVFILVAWLSIEFTDLDFVGGLSLTIVTSFVSVIYLNKSKIKKLFKKMETSMVENLNIVTGELDRIDYYDVNPAAAIAVDVKNKRFSVYVQKDKSENVSATTFNEADIQNYGACEPAKERYEVLSRGSVTDHMEASGKNSLNAAREQLETGLYFDLDSLTTPSLLAVMTFGNAEKWMNLVSHLIEGKLELQEQPSLFPPS